MSRKARTSRGVPWNGIEKEKGNQLVRLHWVQTNNQAAIESQILLPSLGPESVFHPSSPCYIALIDNATLFHITTAESFSPEESKFTLSSRAQPALVEAMRKIFNDEVLRGDTYPHETMVDEQGFESYFFGGDAFVLLKGDYASAELVPTARASIDEWDQDLLGFFYIKPNFPGRCSHICNGGFMVNPVHRGLGIGSILGKAFLKIVPVIGYRASMFNLVFESNVASVKLWQRLGFKEIGRVPRAGRLRGQGANTGEEPNEGYIDAIQFYWDFESMPVPEEF